MDVSQYSNSQKEAKNLGSGLVLHSTAPKASNEERVSYFGNEDKLSQVVITPRMGPSSPEKGEHSDTKRYVQYGGYLGSKRKEEVTGKIGSLSP